MTTLIEDDSRTYCSIDSIIYGDKSCEQHHPIELLDRLSPSGLPADRQNLEINNTVMFIRNLNASEGLANTVQKTIKLAQALHSSQVIGSRNTTFVPGIQVCPSVLPFHSNWAEDNFQSK